MSDSKSDKQRCDECNKPLDNEALRFVGLKSLQKAQGILFGLLSVKFQMSDESRDKILKAWTILNDVEKTERIEP